MKIVFRVRYHTVPGQSLWLKLHRQLDGGIPMMWRNDQEWEATIDVRHADVLLEYSYQLRQENGVVLDEWHAPRKVLAAGWHHDLMLMQDSWCSAGTVDYAFETNAFEAFLRTREDFQDSPAGPGADHLFQLRMAAVPSGMVPCILGSLEELGNWDYSRAVPMVETAANVWQARLHMPVDWYVEYKYGLYDLSARQVVSVELWENRYIEAHRLAERQWTQISDEGYRRDDAALFRATGVAIPVFSLRSQDGLGVGEFADLKPFADWASETGLKLIQILPINDTTSSHGWMDSYPYSAISVFALHPLYLRLSDLSYEMPASFHAELLADQMRLNVLPQVNHPEVMAAKRKLTRAIFEQHQAAILGDVDFHQFFFLNREWLLPYAVFCLKRDQYGTADFTRWGDWAWFNWDRVNPLADPANPEWPEIAYHIWLQYELDRQLADAVAHLHDRGIALKGDLPIGIDRESVDAWASPHLFRMEAQAGAPPDAFAVKGQNWGFPTYNWEVMRHDNYEWWRSRFAKLSRYFDAYRIDHILGFFRIWQVPYDQVDGIMGYFDPALPIHVDEFGQRGIPFDFNRYCKPYIKEESLWERFGDSADRVRNEFLYDCGHGYYQLREQVATQRKIVDLFAGSDEEFLKEALMDCVSDVLFFVAPGTGGAQFHPRCSMQMTRSYQELEPDVKWRIEELYNDYFYHRQESFWQAKGYEKLPSMRHASGMLLCGEDLGMVPACVPGVLKELGILSLEIQRMPKAAGVDFFNPANAPYLSVVSPSTHDMSTIRGWWREDLQQTSKFAWQMLGLDFPPSDLSGPLATRIIGQHLSSPAMWAIFPLQDLLAMDEKLRHPVAEAERINVPAIMPFYWRYRMHLDVEELQAAHDFNAGLTGMISAAGR